MATLENNLIGGHLPEDLSVISKLVPRGIHGRQQLPADVLRYIHTDRSSEGSGKTMFFQFPNMALNTPIPYLPQVLGITIGKAFDASPIALGYLARLANLVAWISIVFVAIKTIPMSKWLMLVVALMPISLFLATSTSADALTYALCFLFIAVVMNLAFGASPLTGQSLLALSALCVLVTVSKIIYIPLILLVLLLPRSKFRSKQRHLAYMALCFGLVFTVTLLWMVAIRDLHLPVNPGQTADPSGQVSFIIADPFRFLSIVASTIVNHFFYLAWQLIGVLGWLDTHLPKWFYLVSYATIGLVSLSDWTPNIKLSHWSKLIILAVVAFGTLMVFTGIYIRWTPVGGALVTGMQGRYFIPLSLLFWLLFYRLKEFDEQKSERYLSLPIVVFCTGTLGYVSWLLLNRYYII